MHTMWFLIFMTEYYSITFGVKSVFKIEFHGDKDLFVRELLMTDNKYSNVLGDLYQVQHHDSNMRSLLNLMLGMY